MIRRCSALLLAFLIALGGLSAVADEPPADPGDAPLRLKKKPKPPADNKADPAKPAEKKPDDKKPEPKAPAEKKPPEAKEEPAPALPEEDEKEVMERIARNVKSVEERLANKELDESTRQLQEDILKDIESLIRQSENPQGGGGGGGEQDQNQGGQDQNQGGQGKQGGSKGKQGGQGKQGGPSGPGSPGGQQGGKSQRQVAREQRRSGKGRGQQAKGNQPGGQQPGGQQPGDTTANGQQGNGNTGGAGGKSSGDLNRNADLYKDVWGHLPESLRAEMNAYAGRQEFMTKHEALIKKYYSTIATQGRKKADKP